MKKIIKTTFNDEFRLQNLSFFRKSLSSILILIWYCETEENICQQSYEMKNCDKNDKFLTKTEDNQQRK